MSYPQFDPASQAPQPWQSPAPVQGRSPARWLPILGAGLGLLGLIAGVGAWMRPAPSGGAVPVYSDQQVADAKKAVCEAFEAGQRSIRAAGNRRPENPADPFPLTAINVRLAEVAVSNSLLNAVYENPAAPAELIRLADQLGKTYQDIALIQLADGQPADFSSLALRSEDTISQIRMTCQ